MPGTSIAVIQDTCATLVSLQFFALTRHRRSIGWFGYHVFFQGKDGGIWMSSHGDLGWQEPRKVLDTAMSQTAIAVVNWNSGDDARLYYQDPSGYIRELCRGSDRNSSWTAGDFTTATKSLADFCAICESLSKLPVHPIENQPRLGWPANQDICPRTKCVSSLVPM